MTLARLAIGWMVLLMMAGTISPAAAEKADRDKPMNIEADALRFDDLQQLSVFTGNVVITKGTLIIRGSQVEISQDPEGYQKAVATGTPTKPAFYRRKRDLADEYIEGEGLSIEYNGRTDTVHFIKNASLKRYIGPVLADKTTGGLISYNNLTDVFSVDAGSPNKISSQSGKPGGRVRAVLAPRAKSPPSSMPNTSVPTSTPLKNNP